MFIVVDGPRCSGKTTLIASLENYIQYFDRQATIVKLRFEKSSDPFVISLERVFKYSQEQDKKTYFLADRFHITDYYYRTLDASLPHNELLKNYLLVSMLLGLSGSLVFLLHCDDDEKKRRLAERNDGHGEEAYDKKLWDRVIQHQSQVYSARVMNTTHESRNSLAGKVSAEILSYSANHATDFSLNENAILDILRTFGVEGDLNES